MNELKLLNRNERKVNEDGENILVFENILFNKTRRKLSKMGEKKISGNCSSRNPIISKTKFNANIRKSALLQFPMFGLILLQVILSLTSVRSQGK